MLSDSKTRRDAAPSVEPGHPPCPVLSPGEYREMLHKARSEGQGKFPWELLTLSIAVLLAAVGYGLLSIEHPWAFVFAALPLGFAMLLLQIVLHECAHDKLIRHHGLNNAIGWLIGLWVLTPFFSFRRGHAIHHYCLGTDNDPTASPRTTERGHQLVKAIIRLRLVPILYLGGVYGPYVFHDLLAKGPGTRRPMLSYVISVTAIFGLHTALAWYFGVSRYLMFLGIGFWLSALLYEYLFTQNQHIGLLPIPRDAARYPYRDQHGFSRSVRLGWARLFLFFNLHKEHHMYPQLPCRYLPHIHEWLKKHRADVLTYTSDDLGVLRRRQNLRVYSPTAGDYDA